MDTKTFLATFGPLADAPNGVRKLRELILQLAVQGKLVPQDPNDEPAAKLLERIQAEKARLVKEKKIRKSDPLSPVTGDEVPRGLPTGWQWGRIGSVVLEITGGGTPSKQNPRYWGGNIPWASVKDLGKSKFLEPTVDHITELGLKESSSNLIPVGRVIVCTRMGLGKIAINRIVTAINQDLKALTISEHIDINYFYNLYGTLDIKGSGMTVSGIKQEALLSMPIPLPPLAEQHRIVAKVDQLMALCDELEARQQKQQEGRVRLNNATLDALLNAGDVTDFATHWQRIRANFDLLYDHPDTIAKLRAAILQLAVQGKLVPQDPKDEPAEGAKNKKPARTNEGDVPFNVPSSWVWKPLDELTSLITSGSRGWKEFYAESGATFVRSQDIKFDRLEYDQRAFVSLPERTEGLRTRVAKGDLLVTITGANVAKAALIEEDPGEAYVSQHVALIRLDKVDYGPYVHKWLIGECGGRKLLLESSYGAKPGLNLQNLRDLLVPLPPLAEQHRIVAKVDQLMALCGALEAKLNQARQQSEKLMEASVRQLLVA